MNIRLGEGEVRCRISCEELHLLLAGEKLEETLLLAGNPVLLSIGSCAEGQEIEFIYEDGCIGMKAPRRALQMLDQGGRQKDGISRELNGCILSLQVDLKTYARVKKG